MAMTTRFRAKKKEENMEPVKFKSEESSFPSKSVFGAMEDKRKALGDIHNRREVGLGGNQLVGDKKNNVLTNAYKDIKPRVDTRWKGANVKPILIKAASTASISSSTSTTSLTRQALSRQVSKPLQRSNENVVVKEEKKTVRSITEAITMQLKKTTAITTRIETKKEKTKVTSAIPIDAPFINSPQSLKVKRVADVGRKFYESHSTHLLHMVENIDEKDKGNPQLLPEYVNDIYAYLMRLETIFPIRENFLSSQMDVTPKMRSVLLDWINEVHFQFNLETETFHMAVSMIDRYLQTVSSTSRRHLQLVGVTALFMASKYEELMPPEISDFVYVTDDTYTKEEILHMELKIFKVLEFNLSKPLPIHFLRRFGKAAGSIGDRQYIAAKYFLELAAVDYELTKYKPSEIAAASLYLSMYIHNHIKNDNDIWTATLQYYSTYNVSHLRPIIKRLALIVSTAKDVKLKSVFNKYSQPHLKFTATTSEMTGSKIQELLRDA